MSDFDEMYKKVQAYEAKINTAAGEKTALLRQIEQNNESLKQLEQQCQDKFKCSLEELESKKSELQTEAEKLFKELEENIVKLES